MYQNYKERVEVMVSIPAVIFVPNRVLIALCFPEFDEEFKECIKVDNEFPYMTLFIHKAWDAYTSNRVVSQVCSDDQKFKTIYEKIKTGQDLETEQ